MIKIHFIIVLETTDDLKRKIHKYHSKKHITTACLTHPTSHSAALIFHKKRAISGCVRVWSLGPTLFSEATISAPKKPSKEEAESKSTVSRSDQVCTAFSLPIQHCQFQYWLQTGTGRGLHCNSGHHWHPAVGWARPWQTESDSEKGCQSSTLDTDHP